MLQVLFIKHKKSAWGKYPSLLHACVSECEQFPTPSKKKKKNPNKTTTTTKQPKTKTKQQQQQQQQKKEKDLHCDYIFPFGLILFTWSKFDQVNNKIQKLTLLVTCIENSNTDSSKNNNKNKNIG